MLKRVLSFILVASLSLLLSAESLPLSDDYFFTSDIPVTYGDASFRERILERTKGERDPIGLVLTGGSARALAHVGVLEYLEEMGIVPDFIVSNSMGSIIALLYAAGLEPGQITDFLRIGDLSNYFSLTIPSSGGILDPSGFKSLVESIVGPDLRLEDLEIPVMVVCDDLVTKREIRIAEGDFGDVLIASFALPVYFSPQEYNGHILLDGGVKSLVPIDTAYDYSDTVIISTTFYDLDTINLLNPITVLNSAFDVGKRQRASSDMKRYSGYIWIRCNVEQFSFMDFAKADEMAAIGYESAKEQSDALRTLYKSGTGEFRFLRASYSENLKRAKNNIYYFGRVESHEVVNNLMLGYKSYEGDEGYLNESLTLGLEYSMRYRMVELETLIGYAFNTHSGYYGRNGLAFDLGLKLYPLERLRLSFDFNSSWYGFKSWVPDIYASESLDFKIWMLPDVFTLSLTEGFEYYRSQTHEPRSIYLFNVALNGEYESMIWLMNASLSYMIGAEGFGSPYGQYVGAMMDNRVLLPLSFFIDASASIRIRADGKKSGVPVFVKDGFESNAIDPSFGYYSPDEMIASVIGVAAGYSLPLTPTVAEFLIFDKTEFSAYFDMLLLGSSFHYSTGAEIQTNMSLIGLVDLPLRLRLGYDSLSRGFVGSILFSTKY